MRLAVKYRIIGAVIVIAFIAIMVPSLFKHKDQHQLHLSENVPNAPTKPSIVLSIPNDNVPTQSAAQTVAVKSTVKPILPAAKSYAIQVASFASQSNAQAMAKRMTAGGLAAFVKADHSKQRVLYRVLIGPEADRDVLSKTQTVLTKQFNVHGMIIPYQP